MELRKASRQRAKIKMALQGPSGAGKTYSALLLAFGLCNDWTKIAVIDTENHSAELYSNLGQYNTVRIAAPYTPEKYCEAIHLCEEAGMDAIILDSISHEWDGSGGILDVHGNMAGNSFTNWAKLTPRHNAFIQTIVQSSCHIIGTIRSKQDYVLQEKNGRMVPEKVGLKGVTRDGMDYEFTLVLEIDIKHHASASKDRTGLFVNKPEFKITSETGKQIVDWCNQGTTDVHDNRAGVTIPVIQLQQRIDECSTVEALIELYKAQSPQTQQQSTTSFIKRRKELIALEAIESNPISQILNTSVNGPHTNNPAGKA
jgi:hypothetical protein